MSIYIFTGPSLSAEAGRNELDAIFLPPVSQGDVLSLCRRHPLAIAIIDGFFERVPAVWHKEILWAMSQGTHVFGAASMGALRAVELQPLGMIGVGKIFEAYLRGELEDDDEVAVIHGPAETGYVLASEAMVNIRYTLAAAETDGIISPDTNRHLVRIAKQLFYAERQYPTIFAQGLKQSLRQGELEGLRRWLPDGRIDQKRADAVALLRYLREWRATQPKPKRVTFTFQHTEAWAQLWRATDRRSLDDRAIVDSFHRDAALTELRLNGPAYQTERQRGLIRSLSLGLARVQGLHAGDQMVREAAEEFCFDQGLHNPSDMDGWLKSQDIDAEEFDRLMRDEARVRRIRALAELDLQRDLLDHLRRTGQYGALARRAREKQRILTSHGLDMPHLSDVGLTETDLWRWYFEEFLKVSIPGNLSEYARSLDFENAGALQQAVLRELCFLRLCEDRPND